MRTIHYGKDNKDDDTVGEFADLYPAAVKKSLIFKLQDARGRSGVKVLKEVHLDFRECIV